MTACPMNPTHYSSMIMTSLSTLDYTKSIIISSKFSYESKASINLSLRKSEHGTARFIKIYGLGVD